MKIADETVAYAVNIAATLLLTIEDAELEEARQAMQMHSLAALMMGGGTDKRQVKWEVVKEL